MDVESLTWDLNTLGELDHQRVKAPYIRLSSYTEGKGGDVVYVYA